MIQETVEKLAPLVGTRPACRALGVSPATIYRRRRPPEPRSPRPRPEPERALCEAERQAVLAGNVHTLASLVEEEMLQGRDTAYHQAGEGSPDRYLSNRLEYELGLTRGAARYTNPQADGSRADVVLNSRAIPAGFSSASPAVFITDNTAARYDVFDTQPYQTSRRFLAGSMVVQFNSAYQSVDVFYVDKDGKKSADVTRFPTG